MTVNKKKIFRWLKLLALLYASIGLALFYFQDRFLLHPKKLAADYKFKFDVPFKEISIALNETDTVSLVKFFPAANLRRGVVIYYHGNMENINHYAACALPFLKLGYEVWMEDYPGFGKSTGEMTEEKFYAGALEVKKMADASFAKDSIIIYGKSLGTGIAAYVAAESKARMLILETPYYSIPDLFRSYVFIYPVQQMCNFKIPTHAYLDDVHFPVVIFHGTKDRVIPYSCAEKLKADLKSADKFITVDGADHHNINRTDIYYRSIDSLLR